MTAELSRRIGAVMPILNRVLPPKARDVFIPKLITFDRYEQLPDNLREVIELIEDGKYIITASGRATLIKGAKDATTSTS